MTLQVMTVGGDWIDDAPNIKFIIKLNLSLARPNKSNLVQQDL